MLHRRTKVVVLEGEEGGGGIIVPTPINFLAAQIGDLPEQQSHFGEILKVITEFGQIWVFFGRNARMKSQLPERQEGN